MSAARQNVEAAVEERLRTESGNFLPTTDWLLARSFVFCAEPRAAILCPALRFEADGTVSGHVHENEARWRLDGGHLYLLNSRLQTTCTLQFLDRSNGLVRLAGRFIDPQQPSTPTDVFHVLVENAPDSRPEVMTFDLFDTLVARRCFDPLDIFRNVEQASGIAGFAKARQDVEGQLYGRVPYGLDGIYTQLAGATGLTDPVLRRLRQMELDEEWHNLFPIRPVVALVRPQDLIVSDMYLPEPFIRRVVSEKCGLTGNTIHLSNYGKHFGGIWPKILQEQRVTLHFGDNPHADVKSPAGHGIPAQHVTVSQWSGAERILLETGLRPFAEAVREARLGTAPGILAGAQALQFEINLPLLIVASIWLLERARDCGADTLLMCSRDCNLWTPLLRTHALRGRYATRVRYLQASRKLFRSGSPDYEAYFLRSLGKMNCLADLSGTGQSPAKLLASLGLQDRVKTKLLVYEPWVAPDHGLEVEPLLTGAFMPYRLIVESLNSSVEGSAISTDSGNYTVAIGFAPNEFSERSRAIIGAMRDAFMRALALIDEHVHPLDLQGVRLDGLGGAARAILERAPGNCAAIQSVIDDIVSHDQPPPAS